ncbi:MAG: tetratricopeptide repeat protein [Bacteroidetes bacterium]|nr:tetratricopeptide repeat protein [Bacteroidota bacterium]
MEKRSNILKRLFLGWIILISTSHIHAQLNYETSFLSFFKVQSFGGKVKAFDTLGNDYKLKIYPLIKADLEKIRERAVLDGQANILARVTKIEGEIYYLNKNYSKAIPLFADLLETNKIQNYQDSASVLFYLKNAYVHLHSLNKAIEIHRFLVGIHKRHPDIDAWKLHPKLSIIYYEMKLYKECLKQQLLEFDEFKQRKHMLIGYYNNRGLFWQKYGQLDSAMQCFNQAKEIYFKMHSDKQTPEDPFTLGLIEGNIGQVLMELKEYKKAIPLLEKDVTGSLKAKNFLNAAVSEIELAKCYLNLNKPYTGKKYLDSAFARLSNIEDYNAKLSILKEYAHFYEQTGSYKASIDYYNRFINFKDSVDLQENLKELISTQVANQVEEKENLIRESQKNIKEKNTEVSTQKTIQNALLFCGLVLITVIIFVSVQLKKTKAQKHLLEIKNKRIATRNEIINQSLSEKDLLIKEVHHRVKNNLQIISSLLKLQSGKSTNEEIRNSLSEAQDRINSMALLHQLLYRNNQMSSLMFNEYLSNLITQISDSFSKNIRIDYNLIELELDLDTAIPLGLITNELVSNAFKHAFNGKDGVITIELSKLVKNTYQLKIADNGQGLPANFDLNSVDSLGLDIVCILSEQINAELKIYNADGAKFEIIFKVA